MTRRERLERKAERRREWADKAQARSQAAFGSAGKLADQIPMGQPILVGHHSERHARRDAERIRAGMDRGCEEASKAQHHEQAAAGLEAQLEGSIYSDDVDAVAALEARAAVRLAEVERCKAVNKAWRKCKGTHAERLAQLVVQGVLPEEEARAVAGHMARCSWIDQPYPTYHVSNLRARVRADRERIATVRAQANRAAQAEAAGGVVMHLAGEWCSVTFAERPEREVLDALKAAGFRWGGGSWSGRVEALPACVRDMLELGSDFGTGVEEG